MTYLDTHAVLWLFEGKLEKFSEAAVDHMQNDNLAVSPAVILELQLLHEIRRVTRTGQSMVAALADEIGLEVCPLRFRTVVDYALELSWVRDPFDRIIVAQAGSNAAPLITKDEKIRRHYKRAIW